MTVVAQREQRRRAVLGEGGEHVSYRANRRMSTGAPGGRGCSSSPRTYATRGRVERRLVDRHASGPASRRTWSKNSSGPAADRNWSQIVPSISTNSIRTGRSDRFAQAWFVPRWTTASPAPTRVSDPSSSSSHVSPSITTPTSTVSVRCIGDSAPGAISVNRTITPLAGGGIRTGRSVGSASVASIGAGVASVIHTSWNAAVPMSSVFGAGVSDTTIDFPESSWPVTTRRGAPLIGLSRSRGSAAPAAA